MNYFYFHFQICVSYGVWLLGRQFMGDMSNEKKKKTSFRIFHTLVECWLLAQSSLYFHLLLLFFIWWPWSVILNVDGRQFTIQVLADRIWVACHLGYSLLHQGPVTLVDNCTLRCTVVWQIHYILVIFLTNCCNFKWAQVARETDGSVYDISIWYNN